MYAPTASRPDVGVHLLYGLEKHGLSLFPEIEPILEILSKEKYTDFSYKVSIIDYISKFGLDFPEQAAKYLITVTANNSHLLTSPLYFQEIFETIKNLLNVVTSQDIKNDLIRIIEEMTKSDYVNVHQSKAIQLLQDIKNCVNKDSSKT